METGSKMRRDEKTCTTIDLYLGIERSVYYRNPSLGVHASGSGGPLIGYGAEGFDRPPYVSRAKTRPRPQL